MAQKRCFVISPIGGDGTDIRKHADNVFKYIIKPAMSQCDVHVFRADHMHEAGKITDQMINALLREDFCVAVLTGRNPNVYYELALAQAAARPVIIMLQKGDEPPFDIKDMRCVYYDFDPELLMEGYYVKEVVKHVKALEAAGWKTRNVFGDVNPLGGVAEHQGGYKLHENSAAFGTPDDWLKFVHETKTSFDLMGISLGAWKRSKGFSDALVQKAAAGCKVRILMMHQDNPCLPHMINGAIAETSLSEVVSEITSMHDYFTKISARNSCIEVRQILKGCPHHYMTRTDQQAVFIQYLYSQKTGWSPLWECEEGSILYKMLAEEFDLLWQINGETAMGQT